MTAPGETKIGSRKQNRTEQSKNIENKHQQQEQQQQQQQQQRRRRRRKQKLAVSKSH